jgi:hypothetical protein
MKPVNRKTLFGSALALALAIFALDRLSGGGPQAADAAARTVPASPLPAEAAAPPQRLKESGPPAPLSGEDIAALLRRISAGHDSPPPLDLTDLTRDPFVASAALRATVAGASGAHGETQAAETDVPFEKRHRLLGVVMGPVPLAVIDGEPYRLGETIDGYTLIDVQREHVVLRRETTERILRVVREVPSASP